MNFLIDAYPYFIETLLLILITLFIINFKTIIKQFSIINKKTIIILLLIVIVGFSLRAFVVNHTHEQHVEFRIFNIANNIAKTNNFCECYYGGADICHVCELTKESLWPPGHATILAGTFLLFGIGEGVAFGLNIFLGTFSIILIFLLGNILFKNNSIGLWCAFILALQPVHLKYSGTGILEINSVFFIILTLIFVAIYVKDKSFRMLLLVLAALAYTIQIRPENFILVLLIIIYFFIYQRTLFSRILSKKIIIPLVIILILLVPYVKLLYFGTQEIDSDWNNGFSEKINFLKRNAQSNVSFWVNPDYHSFLFPLLLVFGLFRMFKEDKKSFLFLTIFFFMFLLIYSSYYIGDLDFSPRYSLILLIPAIIIAGYESSQTLKNTNNFKKIVFITLFIAGLILSAKYVVKESPYDKEISIVNSAKEKLDPNLIIVSYNPTKIITMINREAISPQLFLSKQYYFKEAILFQDPTWISRGLMPQEIKSYFATNYGYEIIEEQTFGRIKLHFFKLTRKQLFPESSFSTTELINNLH